MLEVWSWSQQLLYRGKKLKLEHRLENLVIQNVPTRQWPKSAECIKL